MIWRVLLSVIGIRSLTFKFFMPTINSGQTWQGNFYPIHENVHAKKDVRTDAHAQNIRARRLKRLLRLLPSRQQLLRRLLQLLRLLRLHLQLGFQF